MRLDAVLARKSEHVRQDIDDECAVVLVISMPRPCNHISICSTSQSLVTSNEIWKRLIKQR
jgi:hypothetical protein